MSSLGMIDAPFSEDQVKSINSYQRNGLISKLICKCGGEYYARETGLICGKCFDETSQAPKFTASWAWRTFKTSSRQEE